MGFSKEVSTPPQLRSSLVSPAVQACLSKLLKERDTNPSSALKTDLNHSLQTIRYRPFIFDLTIRRTFNFICKHIVRSQPLSLPLCTETPIYVFPEMKLCSLPIRNSYIHISESGLYISRLSLPIWGCIKIGRPILGIYKSLTGDRTL